MILKNKGVRNHRKENPGVAKMSSPLKIGDDKAESGGSKKKCCNWWK